MAAKSSNLYARIEPDVKEKAESILSNSLGISAACALICFINRLFYRGDFHLK